MTWFEPSLERNALDRLPGWFFNGITTYPARQSPRCWRSEEIFHKNVSWDNPLSTYHSSLKRSQSCISVSTCYELNKSYKFDYPKLLNLNFKLFSTTANEIPYDKGYYSGYTSHKLLSKTGGTFKALAGQLFCQFIAQSVPCRVGRSINMPLILWVVLGSNSLIMQRLVFICWYIVLKNVKGRFLLELSAEYLKHRNPGSHQSMRQRRRTVGENRKYFWLLRLRERFDRLVLPMNKKRSLLESLKLKISESKRLK